MIDNYGFVKVATANFEIEIGNPEQNADKIIALLHQAEESDVNILAFPELCITGYTCADLFLNRELLDRSEKAIEMIKNESVGINSILFAIGAPIEVRGMLFNTAVIICGGHILAIIPKTYIPNYAEFQEKRWFNSGLNAVCDIVDHYAGEEKITFGTDVIIDSVNGAKVSVELCEDVWCANPPSSRHSEYGANIILNLSASNDVISKTKYRENLIAMQSARCNCAYVYVSSGIGESTTDLIFSGHSIIANAGAIVLSEKNTGIMNDAVIDVEKLIHDKMKNNSSAYNKHNTGYTTITYKKYLQPSCSIMPTYMNPHPFVPGDITERAERCKEIMRLQAAGLVGRMKATGIKRLVLGISGGLDSTLAFLVAKEAVQILDLPMTNIVGITMPGFGTTDKTKGNSFALMGAGGCTMKEIDITNACKQHMKDIGHAENEYDITYENVQARERTQILMDVANQEGALVVGTGDMSELALGWCTYNADHMSMYNVNVSIPKTLVKFLVNTYADNCENDALKKVLYSISETVISPELLPPDKNGNIAQSTEAIIGKYDYHDFFLYHFLRNGFSKEKIVALAKIAFGQENTNAIEKDAETFFYRFYTQQYKRSCLPDGPKVGTISLSPRGDWRMPSDMKYSY